MFTLGLVLSSFPYFSFFILSVTFQLCFELVLGNSTLSSSGGAPRYCLLLAEHVMFLSAVQPLKVIFELIFS